MALINPNVGTGLISAGGSLLNTIAGWFGADTAADRQFKYTNKLMDRQEQWSEEMWNKQNEYNSPSAQLQRAEDAGINPNSFLSSGSSPSAAPQSVPTAPFGSPDYSRALDSLSNIIPNMLTLSQAKNQEIVNSWTPKQFQASLDNVLADTAVKKSMAALNDEQRKQVISSVELARTHNEAEVKLIYQQCLLAAQQVKESESKVELNQSQQDLNEAMESNTRAQTTGVRYDNAVKKVKADLAEKGIIVDAGGLGALVSLLVSDKGADVVSMVFDNLLNALGAAVKKAGSAIGSAIGGSFRNLLPW